MKQEVDWKFRKLTEEEEADLVATVNADPDDWIRSDEELAQMRPMAEAHPDFVAAHLNGGIPITTETLATVVTPREEVTLTLDKGLLIYYRQTGEGWEQRLNDALRSVAFAGCDPRADANASTNGCACRESVAA